MDKTQKSVDKPKRKVARDPEQELIEAVAQFKHDPLGYVKFAFGWGEGSLLAHGGPDAWQYSLLERVSALLTADPLKSQQFSVSSGHGVGKTALVSWLILWFMSTHSTPQVVVTANTRTQLESKTWRELSKWQKLAINGHWFEWTATSFYMKGMPELWKANAIPWSKERSEAFAGTHEQAVMLIFDEASAIDDRIWEVAEGAMTTPGSLWFAFGNPTRNTGRFKECFSGGRFEHRWNNTSVDSRTARMADQSRIEEWIKDYGEDSDFVRVRVKGAFPRASSSQFISEELVSDAQKRTVSPAAGDASPLVMGVDVARYGDDRSVVYLRRGPLTERIYKYAELNTMELATRVAEIDDLWHPQTVFVDEVGIGAGVLDRLRQIGFGSRAIGVNVGNRATKEKEYRNLRIEVWDRMREWLRTGCIPEDQDLKRGLTDPEYGYDGTNRMMLESKDDMRRRGKKSPDEADALAMTFALPTRLDRGLRGMTAQFDFDPRTYDSEFNIDEI